MVGYGRWVLLFALPFAAGACATTAIDVTSFDGGETSVYYSLRSGSRNADLELHHFDFAKLAILRHANGGPEAVAESQRPVRISEAKCDRLVDVLGRGDGLLGDRTSDVDDGRHHTLGDETAAVPQDANLRTV